MITEHHQKASVTWGPFVKAMHPSANGRWQEDSTPALAYSIEGDVFRGLV